MAAATTALPAGVKLEELLINTVADLIADVGHVAVGAASPIPASAAVLLRVRSNGARPRLSLLARRKGNPFSEGSRELFDLAGQGRIDVFFLGGAQIDGEANVNLVGTGDYPNVSHRFPGSFGSAFMYFTARRTILFREEHSRRTLVPKVDFVSAPGWSPPEINRAGWPQGLLTGKAWFAFDKDRRRFRLVSIHPGHTLDEIVADTGFAFDHDATVPTTALPSEATLAHLRGPVAEELMRSYPEFVKRVWRG